jgi:hypothetical protein
MRAGLAGLLVAAAMVGAVGGLSFLAIGLAGDGTGDEAAAPIDDPATPDRRDADGGTAGAHRTVPSARREPAGARGPGSAEAAGAPSARDRAPGPGAEVDAERSGAFRVSGGTGTNRWSVRTSGTTTAGPDRGGSPGPSIPASTAPVPSVPPDGTTTTTSGAEAPAPGEDSGGGGLGGLLGGVLEVLGLD